MLTKCTARVSPGRAPSTNHGPVCGLSWRGSHTWLGRSSAERTRPAKQSMVQVCSTVPGRTWVTGAAPPNAKVSVAGSASGSGAQVQTSKPSSAIGHLLLLLALIMHFAAIMHFREVHDRREVHDQRGVRGEAGQARSWASSRTVRPTSRKVSGCARRSHSVYPSPRARVSTT